MDILGNRNFRLFWVGFSTSQIGSQITALAFPLAVLANGGSALEVSLVAAATYLPVILVSPLAGVIADQSSPISLARRSDLIRGAFLLAVVACSLVWLLPPPAILVAAFCAGVLKAFGDVGNQALLPTIVPRDEVTTGNAYVSSATTVSSVIGPAIGGLVISLMGPLRAIVLDATSFLFSWATLSRVDEFNPRGPQPPEVDAPLARRGPFSVWARAMREGLDLLKADPLLLGLAIVAGGANVFAQCYATAIIIFMASELHLSAFAIGAAFAAAAAGGVLGASVSGRMARSVSPGMIMRWAMVVFGLGPLVASVVMASWSREAQFIVLAVGMILYEGGLVAYNVQGVSRRQTHAPREQLGRMTAAYRVMTYGTPPLGGLLAGLVTSIAGSARAALLTAGIGVVAWCGLVLLTRFRVAFDDWDEEPRPMGRAV